MIWLNFVPNKTSFFLLKALQKRFFCFCLNISQASNFKLKYFLFACFIWSDGVVVFLVFVLHRHKKGKNIFTFSVFFVQLYKMGRAPERLNGVARKYVKPSFSIKTRHIAYLLLINLRFHQWNKYKQQVISVLNLFGTVTWFHID